MEQSTVLQLLGQSGITFGHLLGLASISGADLGAIASFGTIQSVSVQGNVIEYTFLTPDERVFKIQFEDRTTLIDLEDRLIKIFEDLY
jgi:hypothetical protein